MIETTDIQNFKKLFAAWLEAETSLEQEQELLLLAQRINLADCDAETGRDVDLVKLSITPLPSNAEVSEFGEFLDSITVQNKPRRKTWLLYATAAAVLAIMATVGVKMMQPAPEPNPAPTVTPTPTLAAAEPKPIAAKPCKPASSEESDESDKSDWSDKSGKSDLRETAPAAAPSQVLEPREVTDPDEAAALLAQSCSLLADCVLQAEQESQKAIDTFTENINIVNEII